MYSVLGKYSQISIRGYWRIRLTHHVILSVRFSSREHCLVNFNCTRTCRPCGTRADSLPRGIPAEKTVYSVAPVCPVNDTSDASRRRAEGNKNTNHHPGSAVVYP